VSDTDVPAVPATTARKLFIAGAITLSVITAAMGFLAWKHVDAQRPKNVDVGILSQQRDEARQLVHMCQDALDGTLAGIQTGTSHFEEYFRTDLAKARQVLVDVVMPVVESRQFACTTAQADIAQVQKAMPERDRFLADAAPTIDAMVATLAKVHAGGDALRAALDAKAPAEELTAKLDAFRHAPK
jgi:hypothetical protein